LNRILIIDGYNMIHRSRFQWGGGDAEGEYQIVYNLFRILKPLLLQFGPDKVYFTFDGSPVSRLKMFPEYKANRKRDDPESADYWESFSRQKSIIYSLLGEHFPITVVGHSENEADDVIYFLVKNMHFDDEVVVVSSDTDFIQILNEFPNNVRLWNPISKKYRENTDYDYVSWKAMVGDRSDNIPGVSRIGKKTASKILRDPDELEARLLDESFRSAYELSYSLIKLVDLSSVSSEITFLNSCLNKDKIVESFERMGFSSILEEPYGEEFFKAFEDLLK
jgi:DNA polymerase-1